MPPTHICHLCGSFTGRKYAKNIHEEWKGHIQELRADQSGGPVNSEQNASAQVMAVHERCWMIFVSVTSYGPYDESWFRDFRTTLRDLGPSLRHIRDGIAPQLVDRESRHLLQTCLQKPFSSLPTKRARTLPVPPELVQNVYHFLPNYRDVVLLRHFTSVDPPIDTWRRLWRKYSAWAWSFETTELFCQVVDVALLSLEQSEEAARLWPHAVAFKQVSENCEVVSRMLRQERYGFQEHHEPTSSLLQAGDVVWQSIVSLRLDPQLEALSALVFRFNQVYDRRYLCGVSLNGSTVGYEGEHQIETTMMRWTGLRLVSDGLGFISIQVRDGSEWRAIGSEHEMDLSGYNTIYGQMEWNKEGLEHPMILFVDTLKVKAVALATSNGTGVRSMLWRESFPSIDLEPSVLVGRSVDRQRCPYWHHERFRDVTTMSVFVNASDFSLEAVEIKSENGMVHKIKVPHVTAVKLSYRFAKDESIIGIACAPSKVHAGIVIKIVTDVQSILFGDDSGEEWVEAHRPHGMFFATTKRSSLLTSFGVFFSQQPSTISQSHGKANIRFPRMIIPTKPSQPAFITNASLSAVVEFEIFTKEHDRDSSMICGVLLRYSNHTVNLLGEERDYLQRVHVAHPLSSIVVHHTRRYGTMKLVTGLEFDDGTDRIAIGRCDSLTRDYLRIERESARLYCAFNHCYTAFALTEEDVTRDPFVESL